MVPPKLSVRPSEPQPRRTAARRRRRRRRRQRGVGARGLWRGLPLNVAHLPSADRREQLRILEALLFAASEPLAEAYWRPT